MHLLIFVIEHVELNFLRVAHVLLVQLHVLLLPHLGLLASHVVLITQSSQFVGELVHELELPVPLLNHHRQSADFIQSLIEFRFQVSVTSA